MVFSSYRYVIKLFIPQRRNSSIGSRWLECSLYLLLFFHFYILTTCSLLWWLGRCVGSILRGNRVSVFEKRLVLWLINPSYYFQKNKCQSSKFRQDSNQRMQLQLIITLTTEPTASSIFVKCISFS